MYRAIRLFSLALAAVCLAASPIFAADAQQSDTAKKPLIVFIAGRPSHGYAAHEHNAGCLLLAKCLKEGLPNVQTKVYTNGWPKDPKALDDAAAVVMYCDGGDGHMVIPHLKELDALADKGVGIGCIHYAVEIPKDKGGKDFLKWIGGYFETFYSVNPEWTAHFTDIPKSPVTRGVKPFTLQDEWYYNMRFRDNMKGVTPILMAIPPDSTRQGRDDAHGGNPDVRKGVGKNQKETMVWIAQRPNGQRGFGCTGGHHHWNWAQDDFRKTILNAIAWIAHQEVPADGVQSTRPAVDDLMANQDEKVPANFDKAQLAKQIQEMNQPSSAQSGEK